MFQIAIGMGSGQPLLPLRVGSDDLEPEVTVDPQHRLVLLRVPCADALYGRKLGAECAEVGELESQP
jgi:hypothetical protein